MRLLERQNESDFRLTANVLDRDLPRYAILSHTWGDDSEEVSYEDLGLITWPLQFPTIIEVFENEETSSITAGFVVAYAFQSSS
jgi:hypothetical protein